MNRFGRIPQAFAAVALAGSLAFGAAVQPARADGAASTRNIILGGLAAVAGLSIANANHKNAQANTVQGYLPNGDVVYGDNRVVARNGNAYYPNDNGQSLSCNNGACYLGSTQTSYSQNNDNRGTYNQRNDQQGYRNDRNDRNDRDATRTNRDDQIHR